ncbi:hypothetical protein Salat_2330000 [Sesamum alatum]|uniref:Uncharacterized protein n=1 Tax=Sesamum alatum TaxID=300844 RepID=A0AAE1XX00_9LAMI|nr:hypothetical protein Salat_2330000 [Sesamum alatum]
MKGLSKPLSSPGRAEKFPPPLMRFLRSNVGSRSRGRSRSSPIFYLRTKKSTRVPAGLNIETTQEPSSPKVTCIGQVRVRRSKTGRRAATVKQPRRRRCWWWLKRTLFCGKLPSCRKSRGVFCRWGLCFRCKKVDGTEDSCIDKSENTRAAAAGNNINDSESGCSSRKYENLGAIAQESKRDSLESSSPSSSSPPKNALLLTRCRSAPYRSSSLGGRFWAEKDEPENNGRKSEENVVEEEARISQEISSKNSDEDLKGVHVVVAGGLTAVHPLLLTRCKSEPARTGQRLIINPEATFLRQTRLDVVENNDQKT